MRGIRRLTGAIVAMAMIVVMGTATPPVRAGAGDTAIAVDLVGSTSFVVGQPRTYSGTVRDALAGAVALPVDVDLLVDGAHVATTTTGVDGRFTFTWTFADAAVHTVRAVVLRSTALEASAEIAAGPAGVVAAGGEQSCAVRSSQVWCWGANGAGQLGDGTTTGRTSPVSVKTVDGPLSGVAAVAIGQAHACALRADGTLWCWGENRLGQLGDGTTTGRSIAAAVPGIAGATAVSAAGWSTCVTLVDHTARCWGQNIHGEVGIGTWSTAVLSPATPLVTGIRDIYAGGNHTCSVLMDGSVRCWGLDDHGQLGDGTVGAPSMRFAPHPGPAIPAGAGTLALGPRHTCSTALDGAIWCWGEDAYGTLGDGTVASPTDRAVAAAVTGVSDAVAAEAGNGHHCATRRAGTVACWGYNFAGTLGNPSARSGANALPVAVVVISAASAIDGGSNHMCALDGSVVRCWGYNGSGQLGNGTVTSSASPVAVVGLP